MLGARFPGTSCPPPKQRGLTKRLENCRVILNFQYGFTSVYHRHFFVFFVLRPGDYYRFLHQGWALIWRCHSFLAVFSFRSLAASKRLVEKKYQKVCCNVNNSFMCWFIFVNACAFMSYTVYPLPMPQIRWGWKPSEMKNLKLKGTGWPIFQWICSNFC